MDKSEKLARIEKILSRGVIKNIMPSEEEFKARLMSDEPLRIYIGADPTSNSLHLSHAKTLCCLRSSDS